MSETMFLTSKLLILSVVIRNQRLNSCRMEDSLYAEKVTLKLLLEPTNAQTTITDMINLTAAVASCEKETELVLQVPLEKNE